MNNKYLEKIAQIDKYLEASKLSAITSHAKNNKYSKKALHFMENTFVKNPAQKGWDSHTDKGLYSRIKNKAYEFIVNPTSASIKNTSASLHDALQGK
jgi:hypothetical protein